MPHGTCFSFSLKQRAAKVGDQMSIDKDDLGHTYHRFLVRHGLAEAEDECGSA